MPEGRRKDRRASTAEERVIADERHAPAVNREAIERRAYERYCERGGEHGRDMDDWLEAERELSGRAS